jgi:hypothetical protein
MDIILISMLPLFVPIAFLLFAAIRRVNCPDCGDTLPVIYSPFKKTRRMWRAGGYLCGRCGCETNMAGQKVTADMPPAPFPVLQCGLAAVFFLVGVGLVASLLVVGEWVAAPPAVAAPPLVVAPPPVIPPLPPAAAPVN